VDVDSATVVFGLSSNADTLKLWPHSFDAEYTVVLSGTDRNSQLSCSLKITNTATPITAPALTTVATDIPTAVPFSFTAAFHTYFQIADIDHVTVRDRVRGRVCS
jgi:D-hexose-6-phosphate mutarotase